MITFEQALTANEFHEEGNCRRVIGVRGGIRETRYVWRRNGKTQTWKTREGEFRIPVKFGTHDYGSINDTSTWVHLPEDCPLNDPNYVTVDGRKL